MINVLRNYLFSPDITSPIFVIAVDKILTGNAIGVKMTPKLVLHVNFNGVPTTNVTAFCANLPTNPDAEITKLLLHFSNYHFSYQLK